MRSTRLPLMMCQRKGSLTGSKGSSDQVWKSKLKAHALKWKQPLIMHVWVQLNDTLDWQPATSTSPVSPYNRWHSICKFLSYTTLAWTQTRDLQRSRSILLAFLDKQASLPLPFLGSPWKVIMLVSSNICRYKLFLIPQLFHPSFYGLLNI